MNRPINPDRLSAALCGGLLTTVLLLGACSATTAGSPAAGESAATSAPPESSSAPPPPSDNATAVGDLDVCALLSQDEVAAVVGMSVGAASPEEPTPPFFGCRYEEDGITPVVSVGVIAWSSPDDAASSFEFGADQYPAVEGIGDRAYRSQPIDDITVLAGPYELSVGLYFVSEDEDADFEMARELAEMVIDRLP